MSMTAEYKEISTLHSGPGGIKCNCCNPYGVSPQKMKPLSRRLTRRVKKQQFQKELRNLQED